MISDDERCLAGHEIRSGMCFACEHLALAKSLIAKGLVRPTKLDVPAFSIVDIQVSWMPAPDFERSSRRRERKRDERWRRIA